MKDLLLGAECLGAEKAAVKLAALEGLLAGNPGLIDVVLSTSSHSIGKLRGELQWQWRRGSCRLRGCPCSNRRVRKSLRRRSRA